MSNSRFHLYRDVLLKGKILGIIDGHRLYCDGYNHYHLTPKMDMHLKEGCRCQETTDPLPNQRRKTKIDYRNRARPRYEVYNKDSDFFHDNLTGGMIWMKESSAPDQGGILWIEALLREILVLLNRNEHEAILLQGEQGRVRGGSDS